MKFITYKPPKSRTTKDWELSLFHTWEKQELMLKDSPSMLMQQVLTENNQGMHTWMPQVLHVQCDWKENSPGSVNSFKM